MQAPDDLTQLERDARGKPVPARAAAYAAGQMLLECSWPFESGRTIPLDHGYQMFSALCRVAPWIHDDPEVCVGPVRGHKMAPNVLGLGPHSALRFRVPVEKVAQLRVLDGALLDLDHHMVRLGRMRASTIVPHQELHARLVTIRVSGETMRVDEDFWTSLAKQLAPPLLRGDERVVQGRRGVVRVGHRIIVGHQVSVTGLRPEESVKLQAVGAGGRRHFGCGWFEPSAP